MQMKSKIERLCHNKQSGSPAKRRKPLAVISAYVYNLKMNTQRSSRSQHSSKGHNPEDFPRYDGLRVPTMPSLSTPFHGHRGYHEHHQIPALPPFPSEYTGHEPEVFDNWCLGYHVSSRVPQTSSPRIWDLSSPPKPSRFASVSIPGFISPPPPPDSRNYPKQARYEPPQVPRNIKMTSVAIYHQVIGAPKLQIYRIRLPPHLISLLDGIVLGCEAYAATLPKGWMTELYSLTKQDIALRKIPHLYDAAKPITIYIKRCIMALFHVKSIKMDRNQPHVLKYSTEDGQTGVELHHDKCDVTANVCLSRSNSYIGGGTFFPALSGVVRPAFGELVIHPGSLVHCGMNIRAGTRHLMILFANFK